MTINTKIISPLRKVIKQQTAIKSPRHQVAQSIKYQQYILSVPKFRDETLCHCGKKRFFGVDSLLKCSTVQMFGCSIVESAPITLKKRKPWRHKEHRGTQSIVNQHYKLREI